MAGKKYYWLKLKDDFFRDKRIKKLRKIAGGDTYTIIYLKMQLLSLKDEGILYFEGVEDDFYEEIALEIDEDSENVKVTILFLNNNGLLEEVEKDKFALPETMKSIGGESSSASRVRKYREKSKTLQCNTDVTECNVIETKSNTEIEKEIELEIDLEIDKEKDREKESQSVTPSLIDNNFLAIKNFFDSTIRISNFTDHKKMDRLLEYTPDSLLIIEAMKVTADKGKSNMEYVEAILRNWRTEQGVTTYTDWQVKINAKDGRSNGNGNGGTTSEKPSVFGKYCSE